MEVRQEHGVDAFGAAFTEAGSDAPEKPDAAPQSRIGQEPQSTDLEERAGVSEPGHPIGRRPQTVGNALVAALFEWPVEVIA